MCKCSPHAHDLTNYCVAWCSISLRKKTSLTSVLAFSNKIAILKYTVCLLTYICTQMYMHSNIIGYLQYVTYLQYVIGDPTFLHKIMWRNCRGSLQSIAILSIAEACNCNVFAFGKLEGLEQNPYFCPNILVSQFSCQICQWAHVHPLKQGSPCRGWREVGQSGMGQGSLERGEDRGGEEGKLNLEEGQS